MEEGASERSLASAAARAAAALHGRRRARVEGLRGPARAALLAELVRRTPRTVLVVVADSARAEALAWDLHFFLGEDPGGDVLRRRIHALPAWDVPPFAPISPSPETVAQRIEGLYHLGQTPRAIVVATAEALVQRTIAPAWLRAHARYLVQGDDVDLPELASQLVDWGYRRRPLVEDRAEIAVRGGLLDVFGTGMSEPFRLELLGDLLESIRTFDPATQRRTAELEDVLLLPATELTLSARRRADGRRRVEERARELELPRRIRLEVLDALAEGFALPGLEVLLPYFAPLGLLTDHLADEALIALDDEAAVERAIEEAYASAARHAEQAAEEGRLHPPLDDLYARPEAVREALGRRACLALEPLVTLESEAPRSGAARVASRTPFEVRAARLLREQAGSGALAVRLRAWRGEGWRAVLVVASATQAERLCRVLEAHDLSVPARGEALPELLAATAGTGGVFVVIGDLSESVELPADRLAFVAERDLFGEHRRRRRRREVALSLDQVMKSLEQLEPGHHVVHVDHGIGLYHGLRHMTAGGIEGDFLHLEYQGGDRLYLPIDRVNLVQKYVGGDGARPALDKLGGVAWERAKKKARESILAMAHELLSLYATRRRGEGHAFRTDDPDYEEFEARFPFEETPDQRRAIADVLSDLSSEKPMDRLVCGDVGYGKTEVALRAAFVAVMEGRQVAVLVPTTVLAQQHLESFRRRFAGYPVEIEMLSSFRTRKENLAVIERLARGTIDVVVGTHRLLQGDVAFARLGLLVVDEEHRFGVRDKERIKQMRKLVDVLTLTATPIPRTLELSLTGIRDLSVIETPPLDRQAIRTYVTRFDEHVIREAILRELERGGQAFFVHNRVESIERMAERLRALVPEARIAIGHGQMRERQLERVMLGFLRRETDVLLCTAIIESGLDIPNANTILIDRADTFGLAQLYQLRGRVGRSPAQAYAYLLIPAERSLTDDAKRRLQVLQELDDLGGGFKIAAHDLEIRGAGNLLGKEQSGHITAVGFELFTQMMEEAVHEIRGEPIEREIEPEIQLGVPAYLPESYVEDVSQRLAIYKRLAALRADGEAEDVAEELRDRFGPLPELARTLIEVMELRRRMKGLGVLEARLRGERLVLRLDRSSPLAAERLARAVEGAGGRLRLSPEGALSIRLSPEAGRLGALRAALDLLEPLRAEPAAAPGPLA